MSQYDPVLESISVIFDITYTGNVFTFAPDNAKDPLYVIMTEKKIITDFSMLIFVHISFKSHLKD